MASLVVVESTEAFNHVAVRGNLDESGVGQVTLGLTSQTVTQRKPAIIDLTEVGFITSLGIGMLVSIARSMRGLGLGAAIIVGPTPVRRTLEMTSIDALLPIVATRDDALRALGAL